MMRVGLLTLLGAACLGASLPSPATALDGPGRVRVEGVAADDVLFLRGRPDAGAPQVGSLPPDARGVENLGCVTVKGGQVRPETNLAAAATWCRVRFGAAEGFANARFLRADAAAIPRPAEVSARIAEAERSCRGKGQTWKADPAFARSVNLGGGRQGWVLDDRVAGCGQDGRGLCEGALCRLQVWAPRADGSLSPAFDGLVLGHRLRQIESRPVLQINQRGPACGGSGIDECWRALEVGGDAVVPAR